MCEGCWCGGGEVAVGLGVKEMVVIVDKSGDGLEVEGDNLIVFHSIPADHLGLQLAISAYEGDFHSVVHA